MADPKTSIPVFFSAIHPDRDAEFRAIAPKKRTIKESKKSILQACTACGKSGASDESVELKKCAGCKLVQYCSTECQKANWAHHKLHCGADLGEGIQPLIKAVTANPMLSHFLQVCIALEYSLHNLHTLSARERTTVLRAPLFVHIDVGIEPTKITDFMYLFTYGDAWDAGAADLEGMLQFHHLSSPRAWSPPRRPTPTNLAVWARAREMADADGDEEHAVVVVQFVNNMKQAISCPITVGKEALDEARRAEPFVMGSALTGKVTRKPLTITTCFEFMNTHIRSDKKNQLLLRVPMREADKELIRAAGRNEDAHAPEMLRLKMTKEDVYVSHPDPRGAAGGGSSEASAAQAEAAREAFERLRIEGPGEADEEAGDAEELELEDGEPRAPGQPKMNRKERRRIQRNRRKR